MNCCAKSCKRQRCSKMVFRCIWFWVFQSSPKIILLHEPSFLFYLNKRPKQARFVMCWDSVLNTKHWAEWLQKRKQILRHDGQFWSTVCLPWKNHHENRPEITTAIITETRAQVCTGTKREDLGRNTTLGTVAWKSNQTKLLTFWMSVVFVIHFPILTTRNAWEWLSTSSFWHASLTSESLVVAQRRLAKFLHLFVGNCTEI